MKGFPNYLVALALMALTCSVASTYDPAPLQDICVAANTSTDSCYSNIHILVITIMFFQVMTRSICVVFFLNYLGITYQCNYQLESCNYVL
jgi:hypothetical protein